MAESPMCPASANPPRPFLARPMPALNIALIITARSSATDSPRPIRCYCEGVPNAAAAHLSLATGMHGGCQTIIGSRTAGLDALGLAAARIAGGTWDRALVVAADEYCPVVNAGYADCRLYAPSNPAAPFEGLDDSSTGTFVAGLGCGRLDSRITRIPGSPDRGKIRGSVVKYAACSGTPAHQIHAADRVLAELMTRQSRSVPPMEPGLIASKPGLCDLPPNARVKCRSLVLWAVILPSVSAPGRWRQWLPRCSAGVCRRPIRNGGKWTPAPPRRISSRSPATTMGRWLEF